MRTWKWMPLLAAALMAASAGAVAGEVEDKLRATLVERLPGIRVESITKLPQLDLYEVVSNGNRIFYTDAKGEFALIGNLVDLQTRVNLTQQGRHQFGLTRERA